MKASKFTDAQKAFVIKQGEPCAADANMSDIGGLLPIALYGRTSM